MGYRYTVLQLKKLRVPMLVLWRRPRVPLNSLLFSPFLFYRLSKLIVTVWKLITDDYTLSTPNIAASNEEYINAEPVIRAIDFYATNTCAGKPRLFLGIPIKFSSLIPRGLTIPGSQVLNVNQKKHGVL